MSHVKSYPWGPGDKLCFALRASGGREITLVGGAHAVATSTGLPHGGPVDYVGYGYLKAGLVGLFLHSWRLKWPKLAFVVCLGLYNSCPVSASAQKVVTAGLFTPIAETSQLWDIQIEACCMGGV